MRGDAAVVDYMPSTLAGQDEDEDQNDAGEQEWPCSTCQQTSQSAAATDGPCRSAEPALQDQAESNRSNGFYGE